MQFTIINPAGETLFLRDDAEQASWTQEEMTLRVDFPFIAEKSVTIGQWIYFVAPGTGEPQIYEVKTSKITEPDSLQQITAEHICISELSDEHMDSQELTDTPCQTALNGVLASTLWRVGVVSSNPVSSGDLSRGSVWQAVLDIRNNWNVYIEPRITFSGGVIGRYLDIKSTAGTWNGLRLSIDKNLLSPSVTIDDTEIVTALYGYGGTINTVGDSKEVTFADVVWTATAQHPAKPAGQTYLELPSAKAEYGRNGRNRFGYYQNTDITDPEILLQKTWEALQNSATPTISIEGTVADLYRLGYADEPIRLHDIALVEVLPAGFKKQIQIIRMTVNLLDPSDTVVTIGAYIPNIIYIERDTYQQATGSAGGGGKNKSGETAWQEFRTTINSHADRTGMEIRAVQNDIEHQEEEIAIQTGRIDVAYNRITAEVIDRRDADNVLAGRIVVQADRITQEVTRATGAETTLGGRITVEADRITQEVAERTSADNTLSGRITVNSNKVAIVVEEKDGQNVVKSASIITAINADSDATIHLNADKIYIGNQTSTTVIAGKCELSDVTANYIAGRIATLSVLNLAALHASGNIYTSNGYVMAPYMYLGESGNAKNMSTAIRVLQIVADGNNYKLQKQDFDDSDWVDVGTFSRATTLSGAWSGNKYTVTASPQGNTLSNTISVQFNSASGGYYIEALSTASGTTVSVTNKQFQLARNSNQIEIQDTGGTRISNTPVYTLTAHTNCVAGLTRAMVSGSPIHAKLYYLDGSVYKEVTNTIQYWYYKSTNSALTTYYS
jgi:phage minor structural protein